MPSGIIMQSGSVGATKEAIEAVLEKHGYETEKPEAVEPVAPKREDFDSDEAFEQAQEEHEQKQEAEPVSEAAPAKRPTRKQRAIEKATRELKEENRKLAERLAKLETKPAAENKLPIPKREDFKTENEFEDAVFDYRYQVRRTEEIQKQTQEATTAQLKENFERYQSSVADFKEEHEDWDEVVNQSTPIHESVYLSVMELENGPAVTYYLGKHPDYARRLAEMTPLSAAMEVGRLSTRLKTGAPAPSAASDEARTKPRTRLPEPVKPVSTAATSSTLTSAEAAKKGDFRAFKRAQRMGV